MRTCNPIKRAAADLSFRRTAIRIGSFLAATQYIKPRTAMKHNNCPYLKFVFEPIIHFSILSLSAFGQYPVQGGANRCNAPNRNLRNSKHKAADQHATNTCDTLPHPHTHMLPLLNRRGWKQLIFKNVCKLYIQDPMSIVLTFLVPTPHFFSRVFIILWFPFRSCGWSLVTNTI